MAELLPEESESQEIGHLAIKAFNSQCPNSWRFQNRSGDDDAGIDGAIQVVVDGQFSEIFHAQFKGSRISAYIENGAFVSVRIRVATLNYYRHVDSPIMLVFADFSSDPRAATCPIYYLWLHEKLDELLDRVPSTATKDSTVSVRVPTANRLHDETEVASYLAAQREARARFNMLREAISGVSGGPSTDVALGQLAQNVTLRGATYLESTLSSGDTPWPDPTPGTIAWQLKQLNDRIVDGSVEDASSLLGRISRSDLRDAQEQAEFAYLRGCLARLTGDVQESAASLEEAHRTVPNNPRYLSAWLELRLVRSLPSQEMATQLLQETEQSNLATDPKIRAIKVRILTVLERFDQAAVELEQTPPRYAAVERVVSFLSQRRFEDAIAAANEAKDLDLSRPTLLTVRILTARARADQVFGLKPGEESPPTGPPGLRAADMPSLWEEIRNLAQDLSSAGWPLNSEFLLDVVSAVAIVAGKAAEGLSFVDAFLKARPARGELQISRLKLAAYAKQFDIALDAAHRLPDESERVIYRVLLHYQAEQFKEVVALIPQLLKLEFGKHEQFTQALAVAAHSARRTFNIPQEQACLDKLVANGCSDQIAILNLVSAAGTDPETRKKARTELIDAYRKQPSSATLQDNIVAALRARELDQAPLVVEVASAIRLRRLLRIQEILALADALSTLNRPSEALSALEEARLRFPEDPQLIASEALICEKTGDIPRARALLESLLNAPNTSDLARSVYIGIATRSGFLEEATTQLESLLASARTPDQEKSALQGLVSVELFRDPRSQRLSTLLHRLGALIDRTSEEEEGIYLQSALVAIELAEVKPSDKEAAEFRSRADAYTERFQNSPYFGSLQVATLGGEEAFEQALKEKFGPALEDSEELKVLRHRLARGEVMVPYSWRPRALVPTARTVAQLWELTKRIGRGNPSLTFSMDQQVRPVKDLRRETRVPLFDLLSLLIITDLKLWPVLTHVFDRIAISKDTLMRIQHDDGPLRQSSETLVQLREAIRVHFRRIEQPGEVSESFAKERDGGLEEAKALVSHGRYTFYSDDVASRVYVLGQKEHDLGLNTGQLIRHAQEQGDLSAAEAGRMITRLVRWNVGALTINDKHLLLSVPKEILTARGLARKIAVLHQDSDYQALASGVWDPPVPYGDTWKHIVRLLGNLLTDNPEIDSDVLAAIWASWLDKVALRADVAVGLEGHLAGVLVRVCEYHKDSPTAAQKLWNAFRALVERRYGARMDEAIEKRAIQELGRRIAEIAGKNDEFRNRADDILKAVGKGLTPGTAFHQYFMQAYNERRSAQIERERRTPRQ